MRKQLIAWVFGIALAIPLQSQEAGRFQLLTANLETPDGRLKPMVFKMDTATGITWVYQLNPATGAGSWAEVTAKDPSASMADSHPTQNLPLEVEKPIESTLPTSSRSILPTHVALPHPSPQPQATLSDPSTMTDQVVKESPQAREPIQAKNLVSLKSKIEEYNRIIQWASTNKSGAWVPDGQGGKVFVDPLKLETMAADAQSKKEDLLRQMQDRNFWVNQFRK